MPFTTPEQWLQMRRRVRARNDEIDRLVRDYFANKKVTSTPDAQPGDPIYSEAALTNAEKNQIFQRVSTLCQQNSADYLAAVT